MLLSRKLISQSVFDYVASAASRSDRLALGFRATMFGFILPAAAVTCIFGGPRCGSTQPVVVTGASGTRKSLLSLHPAQTRACRGGGCGVEPLLPPRTVQRCARCVLEQTHTGQKHHLPIACPPSIDLDPSTSLSHSFAVCLSPHPYVGYVDRVDVFMPRAGAGGEEKSKILFASHSHSLTHTTTHTQESPMSGGVATLRSTHLYVLPMG